MGLRGRKKFGLCWRERLLCTECNYKSNTFILFEEEKSGNPGRCPACINQGLQVGLSPTSIGPSSFSKLLCSVSTPPLSASGMQKCANKTMPNIRKENIDDMMWRCQDLQSFKSLCRKDTKAANVQVDGCYDNALYSGVGKTNCYHGHHDLCHIYSFVCMKKCNTTWLQRSPFLTKDLTIKSCNESLNLVC